MRSRPSSWSPNRARRRRPSKASKEFLQLVGYGATFTFLVVSA